MKTSQNSIVPLIDFGPFLGGAEEGKAKVARQIGDACENIGFFMLEGHGVPQDLLDDLIRVSRDYFSLPIEEKLKNAMPPDVYRGYIPFEGDNSAKVVEDGRPSMPDMRELFAIGPSGVPEDEYYFGPQAGAFFAPNPWPKRPHDWEELWTAYYEYMEALSAAIMRAFALALDLSELHFQDKIDRHITNSVALFYPSQPQIPPSNQRRCGAHSDLGSLTILHSDNDIGGLEVLRKDGNWYAVPCIENTLVVNIGDLMAEWTNDRWISTTHRVVNPVRDQATESRLSLGFFHQPNYDAVIECISSCCGPDNPPKYAVTTSGAYVKRKLDMTIADWRDSETVIR